MKKIAFITVYILIFCFLSGCNMLTRDDARLDPDVTIGSLVHVISLESVQVEGVGLVVGLNGKGSSECPPQIRRYLDQYIKSELSEEGILDIDKLIDSTNTAIVVVEGILPIEDSGRKYFDVKVTALVGTQTLSLENGRLYRSELKLVGEFGVDTKVLADAKGPIFTDKVIPSTTDKRSGYILGGGKILDDYIINLIVDRPDYMLASSIRNRINQRFGADVAKATQAGRIVLTLPAKYQNQRKKFISMVQSMYFDDLPQNMQRRIDNHIKQMVDFPESDESEIALETIGNQCLDELFNLLTSPDEHIRLRASRCMLNLRNNSGLRILNEIAMNSSSPYRIEALKTLTQAGQNEAASSLSKTLLRDDDFNIRLAAYEQLRQLDDSAISRKPIASNVFLEQIAQTNRREIYVSRSDQPRVVIFGSPIYFSRDILIQSDNGDITISAQTGQDYATVTRKFPQLNSELGQIKCTLNIADIIRSLCDDLPQRGDESGGGLGVSYSDMIALLKQMCDKGAVNADFHAGPLPKIDLNIKK